MYCVGKSQFLGWGLAPICEVYDFHDVNIPTIADCNLPTWYDWEKIHSWLRLASTRQLKHITGEKANQILSKLKIGDNVAQI